MFLSLVPVVVAGRSGDGWHLLLLGEQIHTLVVSLFFPCGGDEMMGHHYPIQIFGLCIPCNIPHWFFLFHSVLVVVVFERPRHQPFFHCPFVVLEVDSDSSHVAIDWPPIQQSDGDHTNTERKVTLAIVVGNTDLMGCHSIRDPPPLGECHSIRDPPPPCY